MEKVIEYLNATTKYYVSVLASTNVGRGNYSESKGQFTNEGKFSCFIWKKPKRFVLTGLVNVMTYVQYDEARKSSNRQPYIAAVATPKNEKMFILGNGRNTSNPTSRKRRSTSSDYYHGPLEPGTSYSIFQRIFIKKVQNC